MSTMLKPEVTGTGVTEAIETPRLAIAPSGRRTIYSAMRVSVSVRKLTPASEVLFGGPLHPGLRLRKPIPLTVRREGAVTIVHSEDLEEFGSGETLGVALSDFGKGLGELFYRLEYDEARLGPDLLQAWGILRQYVEKR